MIAPPRTAVLRHFLYFVLFSEALSGEAARVIAYYRANPGPPLSDNLRELAAELAEPTVEARATDELLLRFSEAEVRAYLAAVVAGLADLAG
ncbi:MAG: hypothetical protein ABJD07_09700 [Gemmatimonadaceae bacterium]